MNAAIPEVADKQVAGESSKISRRQHQSPRRVEFPRGSNSTDQIARRVERIDETIAWTGHVVMFIFILEGVSHVNCAADLLNSEWRKSCRKVWIGESYGDCDRMKRTVKNIEITDMKIAFLEFVT